MNPIAPFVEHQGVMVLDGGLATALETRGWELHHELWSAKVLLEAPDAIRQVHLDFLDAGADCITSSTYQASLAGFKKSGLSESAGEDAMRSSVRLAIETRDTFWSDPHNRRGRLRPLVAASIGPYGAFLADGSEYTGRYETGDDELYAFHASRWRVLAESGADLLACETIPSRREADVLLRLLQETQGCWAWMSFSCRDEAHLCDGSALVDAVRACDGQPQVAAVGINCTSPEFISPLIAEAKKGTDKPIVVYPNSGERYDAESKTWVAASPPVDWENASVEWARLGAAGIGGCCRVGLSEIATMRPRLVTSTHVRPEEPGNRRPRLPYSRRIRVVLGSALILAGLVTLGLSINEKRVWNRTLDPVREAISIASVEGLQYPEARTLPEKADEPPPFPDAFSEELDASLAELRSRFKEDTHSADLAYWLGAGLTAAGRLKDARPVVDIGRVQNPEDERVWVLDGVLTAREGDVDGAREILGKLLEVSPDNELAAENLRALEGLAEDS